MRKHATDGENPKAGEEPDHDCRANRTQRVDQQGTHTYSYDDLYHVTSVRRATSTARD